MQLPTALYRADESIWAGAYLGAKMQSETIAKLQWVAHEQIDVIIDLTTPADRLEPVPRHPRAGVYLRHGQDHRAGRP